MKKKKSKLRPAAVGKRGRPVLPDHSKIKHQDTADRPVVEFIDRHMAADPMKRGARARAIDAAIDYFPGKSLATIERMLARQSPAKRNERTFTELYSLMTEASARAVDSMLYSDGVRSNYEAWATNAATVYDLIVRYLSAREREEMGDCSIDILYRIAQEREELTRRRLRRRTPSNK